MSRHETDVIILCGGRGTRLIEETKDRPKALVAIGGRTFLEVLVSYLDSFGFPSYLLCTGYRGEMIRDYVAHDAERFVISHEETPLGTWGAVQAALGKSKSGTLLVLNGDSFCPVDLNEVLNFHAAKGAHATLVLAPAKDRTDGGAVRLGCTGRIEAFNEKVLSEAPLINAGIYVFEREFLLKVRAEVLPASLEYDLFPNCRQWNFYGFPTREPLYDIGTPERLSRFKETFASERNDWCVKGTYEV